MTQPLRRFALIGIATGGLAVFVVAACSSSKPRVGALDQDSGITGDVTRGPPGDVLYVDVPVTDAPVCVGSPNEAPIVLVTRTGATPPTPAGGTIVPGKYHAVAITSYSGDGGAVPTNRFEQITLYVTDTSMEYSEREGRVEDDGGLSNEDQEDKGDTYATAGTRLYVRRVCPLFGAESDREYTATADEIHLFPSATFVRTFKRQ